MVATRPVATAATDTAILESLVNIVPSQVPGMRRPDADAQEMDGSRPGRQGPRQAAAATGPSPAGTAPSIRSGWKAQPLPGGDTRRGGWPPGGAGAGMDVAAPAIRNTALPPGG